MFAYRVGVTPAEFRRQAPLAAHRLDDPPILISLPLLMNNFMKRMSRSYEHRRDDRS